MHWTRSAIKFLSEFMCMLATRTRATENKKEMHKLTGCARSVPSIHCLWLVLHEWCAYLRS